MLNFLLMQEKLLLEPYSAQRDVAYIALVPDNDHVLQCALPFFKELTAVYEVNEQHYAPVHFLVAAGSTCAAWNERHVLSLPVSWITCAGHA